MSDAPLPTLPQPVVTPRAPADKVKRFLAQLIDAACAGLLYVMVGGLLSLLVGPLGDGLGAAAAAGYILARDGLTYEFMMHRSVGKQLLGLAVIGPDGGPIRIEDSVTRNLPMALGHLVGIVAWVPFIGWLFAFLSVPVLVLVALAEGVMVLTQEDGRRFGDRFAGTQVVEG
jgi:uncharacterized RDD family membrane protein YckC